MIEVRATNISMMPVKDIRPNPKNRLPHPKEQIERLKQLIEYQGFRQPLMISNRTGMLVAGHGRLLAAKELKMESVPCMFQDFESEEQEYAAAVSDNAIQQRWTELDLAGINEDLPNLGPDFDIDLLGIKDFVLEPADKGYGDEDGVPPTPVMAHSKLGDLYLLDNHRLLCGDSTDKAQVERLMNGEKADMVFTSPPYNCGIKYSEYDDEKEKEEYLRFISAVIQSCFNGLKTGRSIFWNCGSSPKSHAHAHALEQCGFILRRQLIWRKTGAQIPLWQNTRKNPVARNYLPNYTHENIFLASKGDFEFGAPTHHSDELSNDVWDISQFSAGGNDHPAAFPIKLVELPIYSMTNESELLFEPFGGSGSTLIACEKTQRRCFGMEIDPLYCDVILNRWAKYTGKDPVREDGIKWSELNA